jgi:hypothetical protein
MFEEMTRRLVAEFQPERIILFGSHAWGHRRKQRRGSPGNRVHK